MVFFLIFPRKLYNESLKTILFYITAPMKIGDKKCRRKWPGFFSLSAVLSQSEKRAAVYLRIRDIL